MSFWKSPGSKHFFTAAMIGLFSVGALAQAGHAGKKEADRVPLGQDIFTQRCFQCHSVLPDQVRLGPSLYHVTKGPHPRKTPVQIREILQTGKGKMPSFKDVLTEDDIENIVAYLKSL
jgi:mono/diheme cytochrome c family protein